MIKSKVKTFFVNLVGKARWRKMYRTFEDITKGFKRVSYSQEGEDLILYRIFEKKKNGYFVDIGAHHPRRFSNTYLFYKMGWSGINIDPTPGSMEAFKRERKRDVNLEIGVGTEEKILDFYMFDEPALNSFDKEVSLKRDKETDYSIINTVLVQILPLHIILEKNLPKGQEIDFMSIDVEGLDVEILKSNNWNKFRPDFILIELLNWSPENESQLYMESIGYEFFAKTFNTVFYKKLTSA